MAPAHAIDGPDAHDHATKQLAPELTIDGPQQDGYSCARRRRTVSRISPWPPHRWHQLSVVFGRHFRMALLAVMCWPMQVRSRSLSRQNVVRSGIEKVGLATLRSSVWIV